MHYPISRGFRHVNPPSELLKLRNAASKAASTVKETEMGCFIGFCSNKMSIPQHRLLF